MLTNSDVVDLTRFRRSLHQWPEVSGEEEQTAKTIVEALKLLNPKQILTGLGGHGVAAVFDTGREGPTVLFRAELDALPIQELRDVAWASKVPGKGHLCGHDGHMTMLLGLGRLLSRKPVERGRVVLMFQPAEEDGSGAKAVVSDPAFQQIAPDWAFAIHIEPGRPFGYVATRSGLINCASLGLEIHLTGKTTHAANPEDGVSPAAALAELMGAMDGLNRGAWQNGEAPRDGFRLATITHATMGEPTFGIAPGEGRLFVTLRTADDDALEDMADVTRTMASAIAQRLKLKASFNVCDHFAASINDEDAVRVANDAMNALGVAHGDEGLPMRASEDFGVFGWDAKAAMLCLGPGEDYAALHNPDYDFSDDLIPVGVGIFDRIARDLTSA